MPTCGQGGVVQEQVPCGLCGLRRVGTRAEGEDRRRKKESLWLGEGQGWREGRRLVKEFGDWGVRAVNIRYMFCVFCVCKRYVILIVLKF